MQALHRSLKGVTETLDMPWPGVASLVQPGPGHLVVLLAAPGVGKSAFALVWALNMHGPVLYVSQDTDLAEQAARTVAHKVGIAKSEVKANLERYEAFLKTNVRNLPMMVDYPIRASELGELLEAATEFYGETPKLTIVDVLMDVVEGEGYEGFRDALRELHWAARKYHTCVLVLHHVNRQGRNADGTRPIRLTDGQYAGEHDAEIVLGLYTPRGEDDPVWGWKDFNGEVLRVCVLKNRFGRKDPEGRGVYADLHLDLERMVIE